MSDTEKSDCSTDVGSPCQHVTEEEIAKSDEFKARANKCFQDNKLNEAIELYISALELNPGNHILYANRAFCHIKLENYGSAIVDATESINLDASYIKGYYRRGTANLALGKLKQAKADFREAVKIQPRNKDARTKLAECEKAIKKERLEQALQAEMVEGPGQDPDVVLVEASYDGPRTEDGQITQGFVEDLMAWQKAEKRLHKKYALEILRRAREILAKEACVVDVGMSEDKDAHQITICGDVHGQYYDLINIFEMNGNPSETNRYLFNGDFVDRGSFSVEVVLLLLAYKCLYPKHFFLNRGNHESVNMNKMYGFEGEVMAKYSREMMALFTDVFQWLPLAHVVGGKVLVLHGGLLSKSETKLEDLRGIQRHQEPPDEGPMTEMLWSDPGPNLGLLPSKRGVGVCFGADVTERFLKDNDLTLLIRSHECKEQGYEVEHGGKTITIFSAPNYCDQMGNKGAYIHLDKTLIPKFTSFSAVPHPPVRAMHYAGFGGGFNFMNLCL